MENFMLDQDAATYRLRIDAKIGKFVSKIKNPNDEWVEDKKVNAVHGVLSDAFIKVVDTEQPGGKGYIHLLFSAGGAGPVDPFGQECTLKTWPVKLANGNTTAGISLYATGERCEWKYSPEQMRSVRAAGQDKWIEMFNKFVEPKVKEYKAMNLDPLATNHPQPTPAQANGYNDPADKVEDAADDDLPF